VRSALAKVTNDKPEFWHSHWPVLEDMQVGLQNHIFFHHPPTHMGHCLLGCRFACEANPTRCCNSITTMSNSGSYPVTPVASQHYSSTPVTCSYSGHSRADNPPLTTTLGLVCIQSLPHLAVNPAWSWVYRVLVISLVLYHFHWTWFILPGPDFIFIAPDLVLSPIIPCPTF